MELQEAILPGESAPEKQEIGPWTGNFDFRIKFPTRTKNLRKVPAEWAQEGPLGGPLNVLTYGCGFNGVAGVASPWHLPVGGNYYTIFNTPCLRSPNAHWGLGGMYTPKPDDHSTIPHRPKAGDGAFDAPRRGYI